MRTKRCGYHEQTVRFLPARPGPTCCVFFCSVLISRESGRNVALMGRSCPEPPANSIMSRLLWSGRSLLCPIAAVG